MGARPGYFERDERTNFEPWLLRIFHGVHGRECVRAPQQFIEQSMGDDEHLCTRSSSDVERTTGDVERTVDVETTNTAELLRAALEELRKMKEDRLRFQQREEELRDQLQRAQQGQSLPFSFCPPTAEILGIPVLTRVLI